MRHQRTGRKLSRRKEHRKAMLANLAASIIKHGRVHTTDAKAKEVRPFIERLVTFARRGDLHARRIVLARLRGDREAVKKLFDEVGPRYTSRPGGYTRILKLGFRPGDNSPISLIEFVEDEQQKKSSRKAKPKKAKQKTAKSTVKTPDTTETAIEEEAVETEASAEEAVTAAEEPETADAAEEETAEAAEEKSDNSAEDTKEAADDAPVTEQAETEEKKDESAAEEDASADDVKEDK